MIWDRQLYALIPRNLIIVREMSRYKRGISRRVKFLDTVGVVAVALCCSAAMIVYTAHSLTPWGWGQDHAGIQIFGWIFHSVIALRLLAGGTWIVSKEFSLLDSDELLVTPLSYWQIFIGKWWAAMHQARGWMLALGIVQLGIVASTAFGHMMSFSWRKECLTPCIFTIENLNQPLPMQVSSFFIIVPVIVIAVLETMCCTALGMVVTMLARSSFGFIGAVFLRFLPVLIFAFVPDYAHASTNYMLRFTQYTWFSLADGGTGALIQLTRNAVDVNRFNFQRGVRGLGAIVAMFLLYLSASIVTAWAVMRRSRD